MKPAPFSYLCPNSVDEAIALLHDHGEDAKPIAGGQTLVPVLNFRLNRFKYLIDIGRLDELAGLGVDGDVLVIGAVTTYRRIETSPLVKVHVPLLAHATKFVAHLPIRTRGTIGGSIANFDPSAEYPAVLLALDATIIVRGYGGMREIHADEFFLGLFTTALEPGELVTEIRIPCVSKNNVFGFQEFTKRPGDLALIGVVASLERNDDVVSAARIAAFGGADGATRMRAVEDALIGRPIDVEVIQAASLHARGIALQTDLQATAEMRAHLATVLTARALRQALLGAEEQAA